MKKKSVIIIVVSFIVLILMILTLQYFGIINLSFLSLFIGGVILPEGDGDRSCTEYC